MDTQRLILLFIFGFSILLLWDAWEKEHRPKPAPVAAIQAAPGAPKPVAGVAEARRGAGIPQAQSAAEKGEIVHVTTDLVAAEIDTAGASLTRVDLLKHKDAADVSKNFELIGPEHQYEAQSGLAGEGGPNHRTLWQAKASNYVLKPGQDVLEVRLSAAAREGVSVEKVYTFHRDSYVIGVAFEVHNQGAAPLAPYAYFQFTHDGKGDASSNSMAQSFGARSFTGFAAYSNEHKYQKEAPSDIDKGKMDLVKRTDDGWLAFVQHYFVSAWLPAEGVTREYVLEKRPDAVYVGRMLVPMASIAPGASGRVSVPVYVGPQEQRRLKEAAPGFDLVVDYGWLSVIAWPLFWLLQKFHEFASNWGVAIILLTVFVKLLFFPLSAASYKSMARMKLITPRLTKIRETYEHDRQKMNQAMMELYKTEKINPLGGCFPILIQIPVFIALYWVLLAAIELRHAPFILWIHDLSALDPYFVLPILMTVTMVLQTRMNPTPPDPVQAKVMQFMPFVFSIFFFFFPAGLVLYWLVNNILSILQQWQIQRMFNRDKPAHAKR